MKITNQATATPLSLGLWSIFCGTLSFVISIGFYSKHGFEFIEKYLDVNYAIYWWQYTLVSIAVTFLVPFALSSGPTIFLASSSFGKTGKNDLGFILLNRFADYGDYIFIKISQIVERILPTMWSFFFMLGLPIVLSFSHSNKVHIPYHIVFWAVGYMVMFTVMMVTPFLLSYKREIFERILGYNRRFLDPEMLRTFWLELENSNSSLKGFMDEFYFPNLQKVTSLTVLKKMLSEFKLAVVFRAMPLFIFGYLLLVLGKLFYPISKHISVRIFSKICLPIKLILISIYYFADVVIHFSMSSFLVFSDIILLPFAIFFLSSILFINGGFFSALGTTGFWGIGWINLILVLSINVFWMIISFGILTPFKESYNVVSSYKYLKTKFLNNPLQNILSLSFGVLTGFLLIGIILVKPIEKEFSIACGFKAVVLLSTKSNLLFLENIHSVSEKEIAFLENQIHEYENTCFML